MVFDTLSYVKIHKQIIKKRKGIMRNSFLAIGAIASILSINGAIAAGENTVTSKSYVDTQDALKQDKITSKTTGNVVTYNGTDANGQTQFDERGIFDYNTGWDNENEGVAEGHEGDLLTAGDVIPGMNSMTTDISDINHDIKNINHDIKNINNDISNINNNISNQITSINNQLNAQTLEPVSVQLPLICANRACTLWTITSSAIAHKLTSCKIATVATDCPACGTGTVAACVNDVCKCNACSGYNISASSASQCCSGYLISGNKCGCSTNSECVAWYDSQGMGAPNAACQSNHTCSTTGENGAPESK